jgi:hypothetical protein
VKTIFEGLKEDVISRVRQRGTGAYILSSAERRIVDSDFAAIPGYDWAACTWDPTTETLFALFDSTLTGLSVPGFYWMELRATIGAERIGTRIKVWVREWGP